MSVVLYHFPPSIPSRGVLLATKALGLNVTVEEVDLLNQEQLKPEFIKINPQHTIPTLVDGDFVLWESRAIASYLTNVYGKNDSLYPKNPQQRAIIDQRLYFDCCTLTPCINQITHPVLFSDQDEIYDEHKLALDEALGFLDVFIDDNNFVAGEKLTIADCFLAASISSLVEMGWDILPYGNITSWLAKCSLEIPDYFEANCKGAETFGKLIKKKLAPGQL